MKNMFSLQRLLLEVAIYTLKKLIFLLFVQLGGVERVVDTLSPPAFRRDNPFYSLKAN